MKLKLHSFQLKLKHPFTIAHGSRSVQRTLIVELQDGGYSGFGEAASNTYYNVTVDDMVQDLENCRDFVENFDLHDIGLFWDVLYGQLKHNLFALCALDIAANDLLAKKEGTPLYRMWDLEMTHIPVTNFTIGIDSVERMVSKLNEMPWPVYKIKLGTPEDIRIIKELRKHTQSVFRVDANCGWGVEETIKNAEVLKKLNVEFIEQPLKVSDVEGMKEVFSYSVLPIIADESCITENDVDNCYNRFHGVNIKLSKCGGLTPARRMISNAKGKGMAVMVGCMTESSIGISAIAQLLPLLDYVDMDGALLLENDIATGVKIEEGRVILSLENGIGATLL